MMILALNIGLYSCTTVDKKDEFVVNDNKSSTSQSSNTPSPANSNNSTNLNNSKEPSRQEPSRDEIVKSVPPDILKKTDCSIEENVTITPESGGKAPLKVIFDAKHSKAPCGKIIKWVWDFGDGAKAKGAKVKHTYTAPGTYIATLRMTDNKGNTNLIQLEHIVPITDVR